jgi:hypothetical protein
MAISDWLASGVVGAVVGGLSSWFVARETRKGTIEQASQAASGVVEQAKIGAEVEHAKRRDARRDQALDHLVEADGLMGIVRLKAADQRARIEAAIRAHSQIVRAAMILSDTFDSSRLNELLEALHGQEFERAAAIWPDTGFSDGLAGEKIRVARAEQARERPASACASIQCGAAT